MANVGLRRYRLTGRGEGKAFKGIKANEAADGSATRPVSHDHPVASLARRH
jgi:hypothetical protein